MYSGNEIAIVGMSGRFPGADSVDALWQVLANGEETILVDGQDPADPKLSPATSHKVRAKGTLPDIDKFDAGFFGFNPREAEMLDPQHRLFLECAWEAMEEGGLRIGDQSRSVGVFSGAGMTSYAFGQIDHGAEILEAFPSIIATDKDFISTRVSFKLNLTGPSMSVQCACSTSLVAVHMAVQSLLSGDCDAAIAGGVSAPAPQREEYLYLPGAMLSPDGRCRSFDADAHGTVFTDGVAVIALMRLEDALAGGFPIRAIITGSAVNNDGSVKPGYTAPSVDGQIEVIRQAQAMAGVDPRDIGYVEAHGTATLMGDAVEIGALTAIFRNATSDVGFCGLGSVKANIGHTLSASGVAGIIKAVLALENETIPGIPNFNTPNPDIDLATSPFFLSREARPFATNGDKPRNAAVSSFGVGGTNAHLILQEAPRREAAGSARKLHLVPISGRTADALEAQKQRFGTYLSAHAELEIADVAHTAQAGRRAFEYRSVVLASSTALAGSLLQKGDADLVITGKAPAKAQKVAFLFTGQGSQYPAMGADLYKEEPAFRRAVDEALSHLPVSLATELKTLAFSHDLPADAAERLTRTETAQVALFVMHYALGELLAERGIAPDLMIGHSIGEYAAACRSGVLTLKDALALVTARGSLMGAMQPGTMLSIATGAAELPALGDEVDVAAYNAPSLTVVAGPHAAIAALEARLTGEGVGAKALNTSHAFHSRMMEPMLGEFTALAAKATIGQPRIPYVSSLTGRIVTSDDVADASFWARQIRQPVRFADGLKALVDAGATLFIEVGPGRSLSALARQSGIASASIITTLPDARNVGQQVQAFAIAIARAFVAGVTVNWASFHEGESRQRVRLPAYAFQRQRYWIAPPEEPGQAKKALKAEKRDDVRQWLYAPIWRQLPPAVEPVRAEDATARNVLIVTTATGQPALLAQSLAKSVEARGDRAVIAVTRAGERYGFDPASAESMKAFALGLAGENLLPSRIIHMASLAVSGLAANREAFLDDLELGALGLSGLLKAISDVRLDNGILDMHIVTSGGFDVTGRDRVTPQQAALLSLARIAPQEMSFVKARLIDIDNIVDVDCMDKLGSRIDNRLLTAGATETVVALRRRQAWALGHQEIAATATVSPVLKDGGVYMITGGLGNVGMVFARHFARNYKAKLALVGRSPMPAREAFDALLADPATSASVKSRILAVRELEALGAEVITPAANVADEASMVSVIAEIDARFGRLDGVVHGAGITHLARMVTDTDRAAFAENYDAKVFGLIALDKALAGRHLDFATVISSLSAVLGGMAHYAYAAANATSDALVAEFNQRGRASWTSVNWDAWKFEGDTSAAQAILNALDFAMSAEEGDKVLELLFGLEDWSQAVVATSSLKARMIEWVEARAVPADPKAEGQTQYQRPEVSTPFVEPETATEITLAGIWRDLIGLDKVGRFDDFLEIGGHSLLAVEMMSRIRKSFGVEFPIERSMEANTLERAAAVIDEIRNANAASEEKAVA